MQQSLQTLQRNVQWTAYLSTPGVLVFDYDNTGRRFMRPVTEEEAAILRPRHKEYLAELSRRDPRGYASWLVAFASWQAGDLTEDMPRPEEYAGGEQS